MTELQYQMQKGNKRERLLNGKERKLDGRSVVKQKEDEVMAHAGTVGRKLKKDGSG